MAIHAPDVRSGTHRAAARSVLYHGLSLLFQHPDAEWMQRVREGKLWDALREAAVSLEQPAWLDGLEKMEKDFAQQAQAREKLSVAHVQLFGSHGAVHCPPFATEFGQRHVFSKGQDLADINGFYRAFGLKRSAEMVDRPDHVSFLFEFLSFLALKQVHAMAGGKLDDLAVTRDAEKKFFCEYVVNWVPVFCEMLGAKTPAVLYQELAALTKAFLESEERRFGVRIERIPLPDRREEHAREPCMKCPGA